MGSQSGCVFTWFISHVSYQLIYITLVSYYYTSYNTLATVPLMRSKHSLKQKQAHMILCQNCYFLPTQQQLPYLITSQTIFELVWACPFCNFSNSSNTDHQFKYYTISNQGQAILDCTSRRVQDNQHRVMLMVDVGYEMGQVWESGGCDRLTRATGLLAVYLKTKAVQVRSKIGRYFSWQNFLKRNQITKIEYAFALTDYLSQHIPNLQIQFFVHTQEQTQDDQIDEKLTILPQNFLKTIKHENGVRNIKSLIQKKGQQKLIVVSAGCLNSIAETVTKKSRRRTLLINLEQKISAINLLPTSTALYENYRKESLKIIQNNRINSNSNSNSNPQDYNSNSNSNSNNGGSNQFSQIHSFYIIFNNRQLYIFDPRLLGVSTTCGFELVYQILRASHFNIGVFGMKVKSGGEDKWQQIINGQKYYQYLEQQYSKKINQKQSSSSKVYSEKSKQLPILMALSKMGNKKQEKSGKSRSNNQVQEFLELVQNNLGNRYQEIRVFLRLVENQTVKGEKVEVSRTILWRNYSKICNAGDRQRSEDQFQYFWKRCPAIPRAQRIKKISDYGIQCQVL